MVIGIKTMAMALRIEIAAMGTDSNKLSKDTEIIIIPETVSNNVSKDTGIVITQETTSNLITMIEANENNPNKRTVKDRRITRENI